MGKRPPARRPGVPRDEDGERIERLYQTVRSRDLRVLYTHFELDALSARRYAPAVVLFLEKRQRIIRRVLGERGCG
jgi:hypothetical protein